MKVGDKIRVIKNDPSYPEELAGKIMRIVGVEHAGIIASTGEKPIILHFFLRDQLAEYVELVPNSYEPIPLKEYAPTRRDHFAGLAMSAIISNPHSLLSIADIAEKVTQVVDAVVARLDEVKP